MPTKCNQSLIVQVSLSARVIIWLEPRWLVCLLDRSLFHLNVCRCHGILETRLTPKCVRPAHCHCHNVSSCGLIALASLSKTWWSLGEKAIDQIWFQIPCDFCNFKDTVTRMIRHGSYLEQQQEPERGEASNGITIQLEGQKCKTNENIKGQLILHRSNDAHELRELNLACTSSRCYPKWNFFIFCRTGSRFRIPDYEIWHATTTASTGD